MPRKRLACSIDGFIGTEHLLLGLIQEGEGVAARALSELDVSLVAVRSKGRGDDRAHWQSRDRFTSVHTTRQEGLRPCIPRGATTGSQLHRTQHILLGLVREGEGVGAQVLESLGVDLPRVRQQVMRLLSGYEGGELGVDPNPPSAGGRPRPDPWCNDNHHIDLRLLF